MDTVYVARLKSGDELVLLAEMGIEPGGNLSFRASGKQETIGHTRFVADSETELPFDSEALTHSQREAYVRHWAARELAVEMQTEVAHLFALAKKHPNRPKEECRGGELLHKGRRDIDALVAELHWWLEHGLEEDVVGPIGTYGGKTWLMSAIPDSSNGEPFALDIHADTRALGVARFLSFVKRCGGPKSILGKKEGGERVLLSRDGNHQLHSGQYFYISQT